jgi:hypothetical protein
LRSKRKRADGPSSYRHRKSDPALGSTIPGFRHLLSTGHNRPCLGQALRRIFEMGMDLSEIGLQGCNPLLRDNFGVDHFVWGSDCRTHSRGDRSRCQIGGDIHLPAGTSKPLLIIADAAAREARN